MKKRRRDKSSRIPLVFLLGALPLFALFSWGGVILAHWQVPPESLELLMPLPPGSTVPVPPGEPVHISANPADLRDYHFTRAVGGNWQRYLDDARVERVEAPLAMRVLGFDAGLARIRLVAPDEGVAERPEIETWVSEAELLDAAALQRGAKAAK